MPTLQDLENLIRRHKHTGNETEKLNNGVERIPVSFEAGEQATINLYVPFAIKIIRVRGRITKAIAGTDDGTVVFKNLDGNTMATLTFPSGTAISTDVTAQVASGNYLVGKDSYYQIVVAKTTAGGKAIVSVEWERL
jgi:hypothetical protein